MIWISSLIIAKTSFLYKRYIATIPNLDPKLPAHMVRWGNSNTLYLDSLGNFEHYGIGFVNFILLSDELRSLEISLFFLFGWNWGLPTTFVAYVPVRVIPPHKRYAVALIITIDFAKGSASTVDTINGAQAWKLSLSNFPRLAQEPPENGVCSTHCAKSSTAFHTLNLAQSNHFKPLCIATAHATKQFEASRMLHYPEESFPKQNTVLSNG